MSVKRQQIYRFDSFQLDVANRQLRRNGEIVPLPAKAFDLLLALMENQGRLVSKDELFHLVWHDQIVEESNLTVHISAIRKALGETKKNPHYITTVPGYGYRFEGEVLEAEAPDNLIVETEMLSRIVIEREQEEITKEDAAGFINESSAPVFLTDENQARIVETESQKAMALPQMQTIAPIAVSQVRHARWTQTKARAIGLALAFILIAIGLAAYFLWHERRTMQVRSMAVLPFKSISSGGGDKELEMGMTYTLIAKLGNVRQIVVRPISAVSKYEKDGQDALAVGRELQTEVVLDGSLQKVGDKLRVTVRLLDTRDGSLIWSEQFDEKVTDIFKVQDSISGRVVKRLAINITEEERRLLGKRSTENTEAYELYVKGRYYLSQLTEEGGFKALESFTQAIAIDPNYAPAYAGLADVYSVSSDIVLPPKVALPRAAEYAKKAVELDDSLDEAHLSMARVKWLSEWNWVEAEAEFNRAIELNPSNLLARLEYGHFLTQQSRFEAAVAQMKTAQRIDPQSAKAHYELGRIYYSAKQWDRAIEACREALSLDAISPSAHRRLGLAFAQKGVYEEAIAEMKKALEVKADYGYQSDLGYIYALAGKKREARDLLSKMLEKSKRHYISSYFMARIYAGLGDKERMFQALEKAYEDRSDYLLQLKTDPIFDGWRTEAKFTDLVRHTGLAQ